MSKPRLRDPDDFGSQDIITALQPNRACAMIRGMGGTIFVLWSGALSEPELDTEDSESPAIVMGPSTMLDVHPPHHAAHGWRDFLIHIATITVGLLIAVGLEQTVEHVHHLHQVTEVKESLREEGVDMQAAATDNIREIDKTLANVNAAIDRVRASKPTETPAEVILVIPGNSAWSAARDSGLLSLAPRVLVDNYWKVYFLQEATVLQIRATYADLDTLQAFISIHPNAAELSPAERETMLIAYAHYREKLKVLKLDLSLLSKVAGLSVRDQKIDAAAIYKT